MRTLSENFNILLVEDNPSDQFLLEQMLLSSRLKIRTIYSASTIKEAKEHLEKTDIQLVLVDLSLPDSFGMDTLKNIRSLTHRIPVIVLTGLSDSEAALQALKQNAQDYLVKGEFNTNLLVKSIEYSIERKKAEENIIASEEKYRQMFYKNPFPMWINDEESLLILEVNDAAIQKYGYERDEFLELTLKDIQLAQADTAHMPVSDGTHEKLWIHRKKNGDNIIVEFTYYPINYFGRTAMQAQVNDITENIRLENELTLQKQQLIEAVLNAQENERKIIGRELHDNINQILTAVKLNLGLALEYKDNAILISKCEKNVETVMEEIRKLSKELILPGNLKELGIVHSIEDLMKDVLHLTGISWNLITKGVKETSLTEEQKLAIYRIVQEQLSNILKHAEASSIVIHLHVTDSKVQLRIADNGKGFDTKKQRNGIGLTNIINRAELFNGKVKINSVPGEGCSLEVTLNSKLSLFQKTTLNDSVLTN
jgi:two-component system, NarL family, sensor histidine kinase UhpB